jgi:hypothetical protein
MPASIKLTDFKGSEVAIQQPCRSLVNPTGVTASGVTYRAYSEVEQVALSKIAQQVLKDPLLMRRLCDRIFELLQADLTLQQDRHYPHRSRRY